VPAVTTPGPTNPSVAAPTIQRTRTSTLSVRARESRMPTEHRTDMYLSALRNYVEAMSGEREIIARFKDGAVRISTLEELNNA
jgi:hypothetical protein